MKKLGERSKAIAIILIRMILILFLLVLLLWIVGKIQAVPSQEVKEKVAVTQYQYKGQGVYVLSPKEQGTNQVILYIHGGSYVGGLVREHWSFLKDIVLETKATIIVPDYPLTPQYTYQDVFEMLEPLYQETVEKVGANHLILMGDSAGGGASLALVQKLGEEGKAQPSKLILLSPWLDVRMENEKIKEIEKVDPVLSVMALQVSGKAYAGKEGMDSYLVNPINGPLKKLKNVVILTGTYDVLNPDVHVLEQRAKQEGITIKIRETKKAEHIWMLKRKQNVYLAEEGYQQVIEEIKDVKVDE